MTTDYNRLPKFIELVRDAAQAQQALDDWDNGQTFYGWAGSMKRFVPLGTVIAEANKASFALLDYVREHGEEIEFQLLPGGTDAPEAA